jgi:hypothetical protein
MKSPIVLLPLAALFLWEDSLLHCTGLLYWSTSNIGFNKILASTKISHLGVKEAS